MLFVCASRLCAWPALGPPLLALCFCLVAFGAASIGVCPWTPGAADGYGSSRVYEADGFPVSHYDLALVMLFMVMAYDPRLVSFPRPAVLLSLLTARRSAHDSVTVALRGGTGITWTIRWVSVVRGLVFGNGMPSRSGAAGVMSLQCTAALHYR